MSTITFDRFEGGLDLRQGRDTADANKLRDAINVFITTGRTIKKRSGLRNLNGVAFDDGRLRGLAPDDVDIASFYAGAAADLTPGLGFALYFVPHPTTPQELLDIWFAQKFVGYWYVIAEYADGSVWHHYLDDPGAWADTTGYSLGAYVRPTTENSYRYECTTAGTSAGPGNEPMWPTTPGSTVTDGTAEWTARTFIVTDSNCPHSKAAVILESHIFAIDGDVVRFCAVDNARDWSGAGDAGFLSTGRASGGSANASGLGSYQGKLAVFHRGSVQLYSVDPDPTLMSFVQSLEGYGMEPVLSLTIGDVGDDTFFLSKDGFRSLTALSLTERIGVVDVGAAVDSDIREKVLSFGEVKSTLKAKTSFESTMGGYLCFVVPDGPYTGYVDNKTWFYLYSYSRAAKISAWTKLEVLGTAFTPEFTKYPLAMTRHLGRTVVMTNVNAWLAAATYFSSDYFQDSSNVPFRTRVEFPLLDFKKPGALKRIWGLDVRQSGRSNVSFIYRYIDDNGDLQESVSGSFEVVGSTPPGGLIPVELCVTDIAIVFETEHNEAWELFSFTFHFDLVGVLP